MKTLIAFMIITFALISACTPVVETAEEYTETPTVVTPTSTEPAEVITDPTAASEAMPGAGEATPQTESGSPLVMTAWEIVGQNGLKMEEVTKREKQNFTRHTGSFLWKAYEIEATEVGSDRNIVIGFTKIITDTEHGVIDGGQIFIKRGRSFFASWTENPLTFQEVELAGEESSVQQLVIDDYQAQIDQGLITGVEPGSKITGIEFVVGSDEDGAKIQFQRLILEKDGQTQVAFILGVPDPDRPGVWYGVDTGNVSQPGLELMELKVLAVAERQENLTVAESEAAIVLPAKVAQKLKERVKENGAQLALAASGDRIVDLVTNEDLAWMNESGEWGLERVITPTPEPTSTPEPSRNERIDLPENSFNTLIPEDSPLREEFFELMRTQFADGGLEKSSNGFYTLACVATEDIHFHESLIELPDGYIVTHSIPCQYYDAQGQEQMVYMPVMIFNLDKELYQFGGRGPVIGSEHLKDLYEDYTTIWDDFGPVNLFLKHDGYIGKGHPMTIGFSPNLVDNRSIPAELQGEFITNDDLISFAEDGNPEHLPEQLFWYRDTGFLNNFPKEPLE